MARMLLCMVVDFFYCPPQCEIVYGEKLCTNQKGIFTRGSETEYYSIGPDRTLNKSSL